MDTRITGVADLFAADGTVEAGVISIDRDSERSIVRSVGTSASALAAMPKADALALIRPQVIALAEAARIARHPLIETDPTA